MAQKSRDALPTTKATITINPVAPPNRLLYPGNDAIAGSIVVKGRKRRISPPKVTPAMGPFGLLKFDPISVDIFADHFGVSKLQMAETIGLSRETAYRSARMEAPKAQARTREVIEILARISEWAGGEKQALSWYRAEPLPAFGGRTAEALVKEGKATAIRDYLDHIALGGFA